MPSTSLLLSLDVGTCVLAHAHTLLDMLHVTCTNKFYLTDWQLVVRFFKVTRA